MITLLVVGVVILAAATLLNAIANLTFGSKHVDLAERVVRAEGAERQARIDLGTITGERDAYAERVRRLEGLLRETSAQLAKARADSVADRSDDELGADAVRVLADEGHHDPRPDTPAAVSDAATARLRRPDGLVEELR